MTAPMRLLSIPGSAIMPLLSGAGSPAHLEILEALADASRLAAGAVVSWDGPDDPSGSMLLELEGWAEISIHRVDRGVQVSFCVCAPRDLELSRSAVTVRDERIAIGDVAGTTGEATRTALLALVAEWTDLCSDALVVDWDGRRHVGLPASFDDALATAVARIGAVARAFDVADALGEPGMELMWHLKTATPRSRAELSLSADGSTEARFDDATVDAVLGGVPSAVVAVRDARGPVGLTFRALSPPAGVVPAHDAMSALRAMRGIGMDWEPTIRIEREKPE